jgi:hypothetical protein
VTAVTKEEADAIALGEKSYDLDKPGESEVGRGVISTITRQPIMAYLTLKRSFGKEEWRYAVRAFRPPSGWEPEQGHFDTQEEALEGLKRWRQANE